MNYWIIPSIKRSDVKIRLNTFGKEYDVSVIMNIICEHYNVNEEDLYRKTRLFRIVRPRYVFMYFLATYTSQSLKEIGDRFQRDHTSVVHARQSIRNLIDTDDMFNAELNAIFDKIATKIWMQSSLRVGQKYQKKSTTALRNTSRKG